jgi:hypothetical protein
MINAANAHGMTIAHPIMEARYDPPTGVGLLSVLVLVFDSFSLLFIFFQKFTPTMEHLMCLHSLHLPTATQEASCVESFLLTLWEGQARGERLS